MLTNLMDQPVASKILARVVDDHLTSPLILYGPAGVGKRFALQQLLLQAHEDPSDRFLMETWGHPDVHVLTDSGVDAARAAINHLQLCPSAARWRVLIVDDAADLSVQAVDALLKTVEEPPEFARIWFLTSNLYGVPHTLRTRCMPIRFGRLRPATMRQLLSQASEKEDMIAAAIEGANGSVDLGLRLVMGQDLKTQAAGFMTACRDRAFVEAFSYVDQCKDWSLVAPFIDNLARTTHSGPDVAFAEALVRAQTGCDVKAAILTYFP